jgi:hypothetical protein
VRRSAWDNSALSPLQDPCIISGFDMDRTRAAQALAGHPLGTFVCRFSMNQAGVLVLSCKVRALLLLLKRPFCANCANASGNVR